MKKNPQTTQQFLNSVRENASILEHDSARLKAYFRQMVADRLTGVFVEKTLGGQGFDRKQKIDWIIEITSCSYALSFLLFQHEGALNIISRSSLEEKSREVYQRVTDEDIGLGVSISHLRNRENPSISAVKNDTGYTINGRINWITGYGIFEKFLLGVAADDQQEIYVLVDFKPSSQVCINDTSAVISAPSVNNVSIEIKDFFVNETDIINVSPLGHFAQKTKTSIVHPAAALGLVKACFASFHEYLARNPSASVASALQTHEDQYDALKAMFYEEVDNTFMIRAQAIKLLTHTMTSLAVGRGGRNVVLHDDMQRLWVNTLQCISVATYKDFLETIADVFVSE